MAAADPGMANDRTALAWQRTALSLMAGAAILGRITFDRLGLLAVAALLMTLALAAWVLIESRGRYAHDAGLRLRPRSRGGRAPAAVAVAVACLAATELAALLISR